MTPRTALPLYANAALTVNSPFFFINSFVPSRGSIIKHQSLLILLFGSSGDSSAKILEQLEEKTND
jgi:hypothetical protein